jgi:hypothetical protein
MRPIIALALVVSLTGCQDVSTVKHSLNGRGLSGVELTGYTLKSCGMAIGFRALNQEGDMVQGHICSEWKAKASSVNFL